MYYYFPIDRHILKGKYKIDPTQKPAVGVIYDRDCLKILYYLQTSTGRWPEDTFLN